MKGNDMLSNAAYDTTVEGYYEQIQDIFCGNDCGSSQLFKFTLAGAKWHDCAVGPAYYLRLGRRQAALLPHSHWRRSAHDKSAQRFALCSGPDVGIRYERHLGRSGMSR
jgi:hypothetical protein